MVYISYMILVLYKNQFRLKWKYFRLLDKKKKTLQIDAVFQRNDKDKDGKLSKKEFTEMMCNHRK